MPAGLSGSERKNNRRVNTMTVKKFYISLSVSVITFIVGIIMIQSNFGKLSVIGFSGYMLCILAGIIILSTLFAIIYMKDEDKSK